MIPQELKNKIPIYALCVEKTKESMNFKEKLVYKFFKRFFDILFSLVALFLVGWIMLIIGLVVKCQDGGPIFYASFRVTTNGAIFKMYKFRTMIVFSMGIIARKKRPFCLI